MKWSKSFLFTLKNDPSDAEIPSHKLLVRSGAIKKVGQGVYTYGNLILRTLRKLETIIRKELDAVDCQEILMPMVHPAELWKETNRWDEMGKGLLKFKNRLDQDWCLGATHEEVVTDYIRGDIKSYRDLPITLYQIQTKYRDEIRPRFGLMRGREFIMKDAYSFDLTKDEALKSYDKMYDAYVRIFKQLGLDFRVVMADSGNIGGDKSQEFHILADCGEDHLMVSTESDFAANIEVCPAIDAVEAKSSDEAFKEVEKFSTPGLRSIADLSKATSVPESELVKTMFFSASDDETEVKPVCVLLRGSDEVNPIKLKNVLGLANPPQLLNDKEVLELTGANPGSCGPLGLKIPIFMDSGVEALRNYIVGANEDDFHLKNVNHGKDFKVTAVKDVRMAKEGDKSPDGKGILKSIRGIEAGHIFYLGTKYSKSMSASYLGPEGETSPIEMGCYGLGVSRIAQAAIEQSHDKDGIIWPISIAPFEVHICLLDPKDEAVSGAALNIYNELKLAGIDCLLDDRKERPGVKFKDADLLGMPLRIVVGGRGVANGEVEMVVRKTGEKSALKIDGAVDSIKSWIDQEKAKIFNQ